jgi:hypothetical protein
MCLQPARMSVPPPGAACQSSDPWDLSGRSSAPGSRVIEGDHPNPVQASAARPSAGGFLRQLQLDRAAACLSH